MWVLHVFRFFSQPTDEHEPRRLKTLALDSKFRFELVLDFRSRFEFKFAFQFEPRFEFELEFQFELEFEFQFFERTSVLGVTENQLFAFRELKFGFGEGHFGPLSGPGKWTPVGI